jgi:hypothetical protein
MKRNLLIVCVLLCACGKSAPVAISSSGAFGVVTVNGRQKLYLPLGDSANAVAVLDVGVAGSGLGGAPALIKTLPISAAAFSTAGDDSVVIAASTTSPTIWFIDPRTDTVTKTMGLSNAGVSRFTSGGGYVTGIAVDPAHQRGVLSVYNGFAIVDLAAQAITRTILAPPSENFGYDSIHERILAPFYNCTSATDPNNDGLALCNDTKTTSGAVMTDGLNVIDLKDDTVYTYQDPTASNPAQPLGSEPDAAAADPGTGVVVVPSEGASNTVTVDLSQAHFDKATRSVTAPHKLIAADLTGIAVEPSHHLGVWEAEGVSEIAVADLGVDGSFVTGQLPGPPGENAWSNLGDPHGIAVAASIVGGRPTGFFVSQDRKWVARVDLLGLLALPRGRTLGSGELAPLVTMLDASR